MKAQILNIESFSERRRRLALGAGVGISLAVGLVFFWLFWGGSAPQPFASLQPKGLSVNGLLFTSDGNQLIVASRSMSTSGLSRLHAESELSVWDISKRTKVHSIVTPQWVQSLSMSKTGDKLVVAIGNLKEETRNWVKDGEPREIRLYSFPEMKELAKVKSERFINSLALSPDGKLVATASMSDDRRGRAEVTVWDADTMKPKYTLRDFKHVRTQVRFSPDGKQLLVSDQEAIESKAFRYEPLLFRLYDALSGKLDTEIVPTSKRTMLDDFELSKDGKKIFVDSGIILALDTATGEFTPICGERGVGSGFSNRRMAFSDDRQWILTATNLDNGRPKCPPRIQIWDIEAKKAVIDWSWKEQRSVGPIAISPDKKTLAIGIDKVFLFDLSKK